MTRKITCATLLIALFSFGCKASPPLSPFSALRPATSSGDDTDAGSGAGGGTRTASITDPTLNNMTAFEIVYPASWHFQGTMLQGASCDSIPFPVFRASSPDGLSFVERLPALSWVWGTGPMAGKNRGDCLPLQQAMSAQQFLHYLADTMHLQYVADAPIPAEQNAALQKAAHTYDRAPNSGPMNGFSSTHSQEAAAAVVRSQNGSFSMKGLFRATLNCSQSTFPGRKSMTSWDPGVQPSETHQCTAAVRYLSAPEAKYESVKALWDNPGLGARPLDAWAQAYLQRQQRQSSAMLQAQMDRNNAQMKAQHDNFERSQAVRQRMHEDFMASMQRGTNMSMARTQQSMNARSTATSDWVDYSLDRQTVRDPNTGQISKVSSGYSTTWVDSTGKTSYQTNDPNANPNGVLQGNWTKQTVVHGDGSQ